MIRTGFAAILAAAALSASCSGGGVIGGSASASVSVKAERIKEDADYEGVRVRFIGLLARSRVTMQIDVGFGDVVTPGPETTHTRACSTSQQPSYPAIRARPWSPRSFRRWSTCGRRTAG